MITAARLVGDLALLADYSNQKALLICSDELYY